MIDLPKVAPLVIYDNKCYLCAKFARIVGFLSGGRLPLVGHYTNHGKEIGEQILGPDALEMFWFVDGKTAYGGRAALIPLMMAVIRHSGNGTDSAEHIDSCDTECRSARAVFLRSASLLSHSKKIRIG